MCDWIWIILRPFVCAHIFWTISAIVIFWCWSQFFETVDYQWHTNNWLKNENVASLRSAALDITLDLVLLYLLLRFLYLSRGYGFYCIFYYFDLSYSECNLDALSNVVTLTYWYEIVPLSLSGIQFSLFKWKTGSL